MKQRKKYTAWYFVGSLLKSVGVVVVCFSLLFLIQVIEVQAEGSCSIRISQSRGSNTCYSGTTGEGCLSQDSTVTIRSRVIRSNGEADSNINTLHEIRVGGTVIQSKSETSNDQGTATTSFELEPGSYHIDVKTTMFAIPGPTLCSQSFTISPSCAPNQCLDESTLPEERPTGNIVKPYKLCDQINQNAPGGSEAYQKCAACAGDESNPGGIWTAVGCIPREPGAIVEKFIKIGVGVGGGFSLLSTMTAGFLYSISAGDPTRVKQAKEMMTNSIIGLIFIIFSITILQFIGFTILRVPGFGE